MGLSSKQVSSDVQDWNQGLLRSDDHTNSGTSMELPMKRKQQQQQQSPEKLNCPRCDSTNTKFCYYNNYNKSQPRYFCKACKRHWTKGGMLRNVPVGGGRKNKRLKTSPPAATKAAATTHVEMRPQPLVQDTVEFSIDRKLSNNGVFGGSSSLPYTQNHDLGFPYLSFGSLNESFPTTIPSSTYIADLYDGSLSSSPLDEQPWISSESRSNCNWGWEDIDKFVISDVAVPWDDAEINQL